MFHELLENANRIEPGPLQASARRQFPGLVRSSHFEKRTPGASIPATGRYVIIGIASYSREELQLLDEVNAAFHRWGPTATTAVFDLMECTDAREVRECAPPFVHVSQTPLVAVWDDGMLVEAQAGLCKAREALKNAGVLI